MKPDQYREVLDRCGGCLEIVEHRERWRLLQLWRERYAAALHSTKGQWKLGGYEWHVFSFGYAPSLEGPPAVAAYRAHAPRNFVVCPERESMAPVRIVGGSLPDFASIGEDVYVWPKSLRWSMAFTHEESWGLGPYYCEAEWVATHSPPNPAFKRRGRGR